MSRQTRRPWGAMTNLTLTEYQSSPPVRLSATELALLNGVASSITVTPSIGYPGMYSLTPSSEIGAVQVGELQIEIRPKIPIQNLLFLVSFALDPRKWRDVGFPLDEASSLVEAIIPGFVFQLSRAVERGLLHGYVEESAALSTVRGRINIAEQVRSRWGRVPPIEVVFDEFTEDIEENRLLKSALRQLRRLRARSAPARAALASFEPTFLDVASVTYDPRRLPDFSFTRLNQHYENAIHLSKLILRSTSFEHRHGDIEAASFLVDMNAVFEDFVVVALREELGVTHREFPQGAKARPLKLDIANRVRLRPDISWWQGDQCVFVGDIKYKRLQLKGFLNADLYQLLAYLVATNLPKGLLIYAHGEADDITHEVLHAGKRLMVRTLDLGLEPEGILAQVRDMAGLILTLRQPEKSSA
jgi:5-methylcytosine-specific restriction enzyme subunit McrC